MMTFFELLSSFIVNGLILAGLWIAFFAVVFAFLSVKDLFDAGELFPDERQRADHERCQRRTAKLEHDLSMCSDDCAFCQR